MSRQATLFEAAPLPGLLYRPGIVAPDEEPALVARIAELDLKPFEFQRWLGKRRVVYFGWRYDFNDSRLTPAPPLPEFLLPLRARAARLAGLEPELLAHALVTEYQPGAGIGWHRDRPAFDAVVGISLAAACTLRFRRREGKGFGRTAQLLEPGSAYVLSGPARFEWEHSIAPVAALRYSITFRSMAATRRKG